MPAAAAARGADSRPVRRGGIGGQRGGASYPGGLAQLEERLVYTEEVASSNLASPTRLF